MTSLVDWVHVYLDLVVITSALILALYGYLLLRIFKGGIFGKPYRILVSAALVFAIAESFDAWSELAQIEVLGIVHLALEPLFIALLALAAQRFYAGWKWAMSTKK